MNSTRITEESQLILCIAGGIHFAVETSWVQNIADADWIPPFEGEKEKRDCIFNMASLLNLIPQKGARTLILKTTMGPVGVVVEAIAKEEFKPSTIKSVPYLLDSWIKPSVVLGFALDEKYQHITNIIDLQLLVELAMDSNESISKT